MCRVRFASRISRDIDCLLTALPAGCPAKPAHSPILTLTFPKPPEPP